MGFVKNWVASPDEVRPDPLTGKLPTSKPTPKVAASTIGGNLLAILIPNVVLPLLERFTGIQITTEEIQTIMTAFGLVLANAQGAIAYFKKQRKPEVVSDPGAM